MKTSTFFILFHLVLFATSSYGQDFWQPVAIPESTYVRGVVTNHKNYVFIGTNKGLYRSVDSMQTWQLINSHYTDNFAINNLDYILADNMQLSYDDGNTWQDLDHDIWATSVFFDKNNNMLVGAMMGLYKSSDYGQNWSLVLSYSQSETIFSICETSNGYLYAVSTKYTGGGGVYRSVDGGDTWTNVGLQGEWLYSIASNSGDQLFTCAYSSGIFKSIDYGNSWSHIEFGMDAVSLVVDKEDKIYVGCDAEYWLIHPGIYLSNDSGVTWQAINIGLTNLHTEKMQLGYDGYLYAVCRDDYGHSLFRSTFPVCTPDHVFKLPEKNDIQIYPNPAKDYLTIDLRNSCYANKLINITLYSYIGCIIRKFKVKDNPIFNLPIQDLSAGNYIIEIQEKDEKIFKKFFITKY